ncbi:pilus assembly protein PilP [Salinisphaera shabanensis]|uniref:pilus assembly protein PilP n=1 Tax=Salinisphaera shabanensis TaxID=180542 RepID=UPI0033425513
MMPYKRASAIAGLCLVLAGCGGDDRDLQNFVAEVKQRPAAPIEPIPEIAPYTPYTYEPDGRRIPFTPTTPRREVNRNNDLAPDADRPREALEAFPLDSLRLVGTISSRGVTYALIQAPDGVVYRVTRGAHLGQNYGEIDGISDNGVLLTEIVPDGLGGYIRRPATIAPSR